MAYIQNGIGYTLKCDKCGTLLHRKGKDKPFLSLDINELDSIAKEYGWLINKRVHKCTKFYLYKITIMTESDLKYWKAVLNGVVPEHLVTPEVVALRDQQNKMLSLMAKKNADYGNAFNKGCDKLGYRYGLARMYDKANRLVHLIEDDFQGYSNPNVEDESMFDTIQDLGNYCNMLLAWQASNDGHEPTIPSTGRVETVFIDISNLVKTDKLILIEETSKKDVTNEIISAYGFEHLCKDKDGYVYNLSADDKEIPVTSEHKENIVAISHEDYEAGKDFVKRKK